MIKSQINLLKVFTPSLELDTPNSSGSLQFRTFEVRKL